MLLNGPFGGTVASPLQASLFHFFKSPAAFGQLFCKEEHNHFQHHLPREKNYWSGSTNIVTFNEANLLWCTVFALVKNLLSEVNQLPCLSGMLCFFFNWGQVKSMGSRGCHSGCTVIHQQGLDSWLKQNEGLFQFFYKSTLLQTLIIWAACVLMAGGVEGTDSA